MAGQGGGSCRRAAGRAPLPVLARGAGAHCSSWKHQGPDRAFGSQQRSDGTWGLSNTPSRIACAEIGAGAAGADRLPRGLAADFWTGPTAELTAPSSSGSCCRTAWTQVGWPLPTGQAGRAAGHLPSPFAQPPAGPPSNRDLAARTAAPRTALLQGHSLPLPLQASPSSTPRWRVYSMAAAAPR
jgi:hypothetical protein